MEQNQEQQPSKSIVAQITPWRPDTLWWVVVAEGAIALLIGIYFIVLPEQASGTLIQVIGGYLLVTSIIAIVQLITHKGEPEGTPARWIRIGVGLIAGVVAFFFPWTATIDAPAAGTVLALGLLIVGALGIYAIIGTHAVAGWRWGQMIIYVFYVLLALGTFYSNITGSASRALPLLGWIFVLGGIGLIGYGIWMYQKLSAAKAAAIAASVPATSSDTAADAPAASAEMPNQPAPSASGTPAPTTPPIQPAPGKSSTVTVDGNSDDGKAVEP